MNYIVCNFADNTKLALEVSLMGIAAVFAVLALLWGAIELFRVLYQASQNKDNTAEPIEKKEETRTAPAVTVIPENVPETVSVGSTDEELVAAITAALAMYLDRPQSSFRVVSFKKAANGAHWNK